jgi:hypothetical protein
MFRALRAERQAFFSWLVLQLAAAGEKGIARSTVSPYRDIFFVDVDCSSPAQKHYYTCS